MEDQGLLVERRQIRVDLDSLAELTAAVAPVTKPGGDVVEGLLGVSELSIDQRDLRS
jgi:hypothetical protein